VSHQHDPGTVLRINAYFTELASAHLDECPKHKDVYFRTNIACCVPCGQFVCIVCGTEEPFASHIVDVPDDDAQNEAWMCETLAQGEAFARAHSHGSGVGRVQ
jgi:hypothetical protein